jgi:hypothetical protein
LCPEFDAVDDVVDNLVRAAFHIGHTDPECVSVIVHPELVDATKTAIDDVTLSPDYDPVVIERLKDIADRVQIIPRGSIQEQKALFLHDVIAVWDMQAFNESRWTTERGTRKRNRTIYDIDNHATRHGASNYAVMADQIAGGWEGTEHERFLEMAKSLPGRHASYLIGSGPSARAVLDHDVSDGLGIVCNTVVLDDDIMHHVQPRVLTFADPIFHFGPSSYASEFRAAVRRRMAVDPTLWAVIPMQYRSLLTSLMPEHDDRIIGIPFQKRLTFPNLDLLTRFSVYPSANILTLFMLPLATTLTRRIGLIGFDGREPDDEGFWKHGSTVQLTHQMEAVRRVHPGFFDLDYEDYYDEHVAFLRRFVERAEARGIVPSSLTESHITPLRSRTRVWSHREVTWHSGSVDAPASTVAVSIDPDWDSSFGHHGPWFRAFARECDHRKIPPFSLASRALVSSDDRALATFSYPTTNPLAAPIYAPQFEIELSSALDRLAGDGEFEIMAFFYCADVWHLPAIIRLADRWLGRVRMHVNLMRAHPFVTGLAERAEPDRSQLRALGGLLEIAENAGVHVYVDTEELAGIVEDLCHVRPGVLPMAAAADPEIDANEREGPLVVYCPALSQEVKGTVDFAQAAAALAASYSGRVEFRMRQVRQPGGTMPNVDQAIEAARKAGVTIIEGELTDEGFSELVDDADVVVVPYRSSSFRTRTSAAVIDAVRAGKPVVAADGTWGASIVDQHGAGLPFRSDDVDDLKRAIIEAVNRYPNLRARAIEAAPSAQQRFSMSTLVDHLLTDETDPRGGGPTDLERVADLDVARGREGSGFCGGEPGDGKGELGVGCRATSRRSSDHPQRRAPQSRREPRLCAPQPRSTPPGNRRGRRGQGRRLRGKAPGSYPGPGDRRRPSTAARGGSVASAAER